MSHPWLTRLLILGVFIGIASAKPSLGWAIVIGLGCYVIGMLVWSWMSQRKRNAPASRLQTLVFPINQADLAFQIKEAVAGQNEAADAVAQTVAIALARPKRTQPVGVFCLAGPPGVGKSYFVQVVASILGKMSVFPADSFLFVDMTRHDKNSLFGDKSEDGELVRHLRAYPNSVVLLDEFEKAPKEVQNGFLVPWNDGLLDAPASGEKLPLCNTLFFLTTNAAYGALCNSHASGQKMGEQRNQALKNALAQEIPSAIVSRIHQIFVFHPLAEMNLAKAVAGMLQEYVRSFGLEIERIEPESILDIVGRHEESGSRDARTISEIIQNSWGEELRRLTHKNAHRIAVTIDSEKTEFKILETKRN